MLLFVWYVSGIGAKSKRHLTDWEDKLIDELVDYDYARTVEMNRELDEELSKCSLAAEHEYQMEIDRIVNKYGIMFEVSRRTRVRYGATPLAIGTGWLLCLKVSYFLGSQRAEGNPHKERIRTKTRTTSRQVRALSG